MTTDELVWEVCEIRQERKLDKLQASMEAAQRVRQATQRWLTEKTADDYEDRLDRSVWWL